MALLLFPFDKQSILFTTTQQQVEEDEDHEQG
jgi:hypothetical protein